MVELSITPEVVVAATSFGVFAMAVSAALRKMIIQSQKGCCGDCGKYIGNQLQIHHKLPKSLGGGNNIDNLIGLCNGPEGCHSKWDYMALNQHSLPDGTPLKIPKNIQA